MDLYIHDASDCIRGVEADPSTPLATVDIALGRNPTHRLLGVPDLLLGSLQQRIYFLLLLGMTAEHKSCLDCIMSDGAQIEEIATTALHEPCCGTGCEPCEWEQYYRTQARERTLANSPSRKRKAVQLVLDGQQVQPEAPRVPLLLPSAMRPVSLIQQQPITADVLLLSFRCKVADECSPPWHVRLQVSDSAGHTVARSYTALRCSNGTLELLVKIHPQGRCTQALNQLLVGQCVQVPLTWL